MRSNITLFIRVALTVLLLPVGLFMILSKHYGNGDAYWVLTAMSTIIGYWFGNGRLS